MLDRNIGALPVIEDSRLIGLVTEFDLVRGFAEEEMAMIARDVMSAPVYFVSPDETIAHARNLMVKHKISRVLVMEDGKLDRYPHEKGYRLPLPEQGTGMAASARSTGSRWDALATENPVTVNPDTGIEEDCKVVHRTKYQQRPGG